MRGRHAVKPASSVPAAPTRDRTVWRCRHWRVPNFGENPEEFVPGFGEEREEECPTAPFYVLRRLQQPAPGGTARDRACRTGSARAATQDDTERSRRPTPERRRGLKSPDGLGRTRRTFAREQPRHRAVPPLRQLVSRFGDFPYWPDTHSTELLPVAAQASSWHAKMAVRRHVPPAHVSLLNNLAFELMTWAESIEPAPAAPKQPAICRDARSIRPFVGRSRSAVRPRTTTVPALRPGHKVEAVPGVSVGRRRIRNQVPPRR